MAQAFRDTPILTMSADGRGLFGECLPSARGRYARHFRAIRANRTRQAVTFAADPRTGEPLGHVDYCCCVDRTGEETVFAFHHRVMRKLVLIAAPADGQRGAAIACIRALGLVVPPLPCCERPI
jgi:hypothetical protein